MAPLRLSVRPGAAPVQFAAAAFPRQFRVRIVRDARGVRTVGILPRVPAAEKTAAVEAAPVKRKSAAGAADAGCVEKTAVGRDGPAVVHVGQEILRLEEGGF